jgi:small-conductance mechanosensitive channel
MMRQIGTFEPPTEQVLTWFDRLTSAETLELWGQRLAVIVIVLIVTLVVLKVGRRLIVTLQQARDLPDAVVLPIRRVLTWAVLVTAALVALQLMGVAVSTVWTALSAVLALIAVGFVAVWSVLSNVACSFLLLVFKPFRIGDTVEIVDSAAGPNVTGRVTDVTLMYTVLREEAADGGEASFAQVPNNVFFQKTIRRRAGRRSIPLEAHVDKHGLVGREQTPP